VSAVSDGRPDRPAAAEAVTVAGDDPEPRTRFDGLDWELDRLSAPYEPQAGYWAHYIRVWAFRQSRQE